MTLRPLLFETDVQRVRLATQAGIAGFICDWEVRGKAERQAGAGMEQNSDTPEDVRRVRAATDRAVICRVNALWAGSEAEIDAACAAGAHTVLLPMVRRAKEVEHALRLLRERAKLAVLAETADFIERVRDFAEFPLDFVYVGFNDLHLDRASPYFAPLYDGTLDRIRASLPAQRLGFAGLTALGAGSPLSCDMLLAEMARLRCDVAFLRRSFKRDAPVADWPTVVATLQARFAELCRRTDTQVGRDHQRMLSESRAVI